MRLKTFLAICLTAAVGLWNAGAAAAEQQADYDSCSLLRIGYIESSFSPSERRAFQDTFRYLQEKLPNYKIRVRNYLVRDLERGEANNEFEFFIGSSGFYRRVFRRGLKDLAMLMDTKN